MPIFDNLKKYIKDEDLKKFKDDSRSETKKNKNKLSIFSRMMLHGGNAADLGSTIHALGKDGLKESNPIYGKNPSATKLSLIKAGSSAATDFALSHVAKKKPKLANGIAKGIGIGMLAIAASNMNKASKK